MRLANTARDVARFRTAAVLSFVTVLYFLPFVRLLHRVGDEGTIVYGAQRVLEGAVPYRDFLEVMGPGSFYWLALFFKLFGDTWQVSRLCILVTGVLSALLVYWIARQVLSPKAALLPWLFAIVLTIPLWPASNHHWDSNLFALSAVACFLAYLKRRKYALLLAAGMLAGLTSCFLQQKGCYVVLALAVILIICRVRVVRSLSILLAGYVGVGALVLIYFHSSGALTNLLYCTLEWPLFGYKTLNTGVYFKSLIVALEAGSLFFHILPLPMAFLFQTLCFVPFILLIGAPLVPIIVAVACACRWNARSALTSNASLTILLSSLALWLAEVHRKDIFHLAFGAPLLVIALVHLVNAVSPSRIKRACLVTITLALICVAAGNFWNTRGGYLIQTRRGPVLSAVQDDALSFLSNQVPARDPVFVYPYYPMYYYLADLRNPTRFSILLYHYNTAEHFNEVIRDLETKHVRFVLWDTLVDGANLRTWFAGYVPPAPDELKLEQYLSTSFDLVAVKNGFRILRRKP